MKSYSFAGVVAGLLIVFAMLTTMGSQALAVGGSNRNDGDHSKTAGPTAEKTITGRAKVPGKAQTKEAPSQKELDRYRKQRQAELKRLKKLYDQCVKDADTDAETKACETRYLADRMHVLVDPRDVARKVVARLQLPASTPILGPAPELNVYSPGDLVVNYPYWLSVPGKSSLSTTETADGLTLTLTARRTQAVFDMGNGDIVTCTKMLPWPGREHELDRQGRPVVSPVCGYRYPDRGTRTISATVTWDVAWSGGGLSGVIRITHTDSVELDVIELHSVNR